MKFETKMVHTAKVSKYDFDSTPDFDAIGKQIDKMQGNERERIGEGYGKTYVHQNKINVEQGFRPKDYYEDNDGEFEVTKGNSEWEGWGTALKPACEPIVVARKPLSEKNVALNVLKWETGGINIGESRINYQNENDRSGWHKTGADGSKGFQGENTFKIRPISAEEIQERTYRLEAVVCKMS